LQKELMKTQFRAARQFPGNHRAFTFVEVMVATSIALFLFISFYAALASGIGTIQMARENVRATQIMVNRMEGIRLCRWDQLTDTTLVPTSFTETFYPNAASGNQGFTYTGTITIVPAALASPASSYSTNMYRVTVQLNWQSTGPQHTRQMTTYCAKYGIQNYVWASN
jgi:type II secretory pathway pseudopilin PulG